MNQLISSLTKVSFRLVAKPLLFALPPDTVHSFAVLSGSVMQRSKLMLWMVTAMWSHHDLPYLSQTIHGISFDGPIGLSAGFDKNIELAPMIKAIGMGYMEGGTLTNQPSNGNPRPWFYRLRATESIVVHAGLANQGVAKIMARIRTYPAATFDHFPLNVSVATSNVDSITTVEGAIDDWIAGIKTVLDSPATRIVTLNISCPNVYGGKSFTDPRLLDALLSRVDGLKCHVPVFIKMPSCQWPQFQALLEVAARHNVQGVTICNLVRDRLGVSPLDSLPDAVRGGLSGRPVFDISNELIKATYRRYKNRFTIIGVGGVFSAADAYQKIRLGASLVEMITGIIFTGPQVIGQINKDLVVLLQRDGLASINDAIGADA